MNNLDGAESYGAKDITVLEGLEAVRKRPGMYIGSTGPSGLHHLVYEVVDNSVDEAMAGYCTHIDIVLLPDGGCEVIDNGRGIPVEVKPEYGRSAADRPYSGLMSVGMPRPLSITSQPPSGNNVMSMCVQ